MCYSPFGLTGLPSEICYRVISVWESRRFSSAFFCSKALFWVCVSFLGLTRTWLSAQRQPGMCTATYVLRRACGVSCSLDPSLHVESCYPSEVRKPSGSTVIPPMPWQHVVSLTGTPHIECLHGNISCANKIVAVC